MIRVTRANQGKSDGMDEAVARFAFAYAEQTDRDYDALVKAAKEKRIRVATTGNRTGGPRPKRTST